MACALHCGKRERLNRREDAGKGAQREGAAPGAGGRGGHYSSQAGWVRGSGCWNPVGAQSTWELRPVTLARGTRPPHGAGGEGRGNEETRDLACPGAPSASTAVAPCIHPEAAVSAGQTTQP